MKIKNILIYITFLLSPIVTFSQFTPDQIAMLKYWYYRDRLNTNFCIGMGTSTGQTIKCNQRLNEGEAKWADGTINHSYYVSVLAMEYRMLTDAGLPADNTIEELYTALITLTSKV